MFLKLHRLQTILICVFVLMVSTAAARAEAPYREVLPPDVVEKYDRYLEQYKARHIDRGGTVEARLDEETKTKVVEYYGLGDSQGWTGVTMAAFALQGDWDLVRTNLTYWPLCEVEPGNYKRYPDMDITVEPYNQTSIDQYGEMIEGIAIVWLIGPDDLKQKVRQIIRNIIVYGNEHGWVFGQGPFTNLEDIRFLFQLFAEEMELDVSALKEGEDFDTLKNQFFGVMKSAPLIHQMSSNYFTLNLHYERLLVARLLRPGLEGLNQAVKDWYKVVRNDDNTMFDWFYARVAGKDTSFVIDRLRDFPPNLPNLWEPTGYHWGNRWERSPEHLSRKATGEPIEYNGMDFFALASFYSYYELNEF